jgi:hypothetical protein
MSPSKSKRPTAWCLAWLIAGASGCSPTFDWRQVRSDPDGLAALFPCRPDRAERPVQLAGTRTVVRLLSCSVDESTFGLLVADVTDPGRVTATLRELQGRALANIGASTPAVSAWSVKGMTPNPLAQRWSVVGRLSDGTAVHEHAVFFARGVRVYQGSVIGASPIPGVTESFLSGFTLPD